MGEEIDLEKFQIKLQKDFAEFRNYLSNVAHSYLSADIGHEIGSSKKELVLENEIMELYRYQGEADVPNLIVTPLINGYYILDILPEASFIQYLVENKMAPYIIKWKNIPEYKEELDFDYYVENGVKKALDTIYERENKNMILTGHCLGGLMTSSYLAAYADERILKYLSLNTPYDFSKMEEVGKLTSPELVDVDKLVDAMGNVPASFMNLSFQFINPMMRLKSTMSLFYNYFNEPFLRIYKALLYWRDDNIDMPGEFARNLVKDFFQQNKLFQEKKKVNGKKASLKNIKIPVMNVMSTNDDVAPAPACEALKEKTKISKLVLPDGHISIVTMSLMGEDPKKYWKKILTWLKKQV
jgi:polyhydroxyalkanoate synthase